MRFGIMALQLGALIPPELDPHDLADHISEFDQAQVVQTLSAHSFDPIELDGDLALFLPQSSSPAAIDRLAALKAETGVSYTVHLPLWSVEPSTPLAPVRQGSVDALLETIHRTRSLEPAFYVFHATGSLAAEFYRMDLPPSAHAFLLHQFQSNARASVESVLAASGLPSRQLAVETVEFPLKLTLELAHEFDLSICFDTGHVLAGFSGEVDFFDALERSLSRLGEIHLHDSPHWRPGEPPLYGQDHQALGQGDLDLSRFLDCLDRARFEGPIILEMTADEALESLRQIESVRPDLFA